MENEATISRRDNIVYTARELIEWAHRHGASVHLTPQDAHEIVGLLAAVTAERDSVQAEFQETEAECERLGELVEWHEANQDRLMPKYYALERERDRLRAAFEQYGFHLADCARMQFIENVCDCGFDTALAATPPAPEDM